MFKPRRRRAGGVRAGLDEGVPFPDAPVAMARVLPPGKLPTDLLERLLAYTSVSPDLTR